MTLILGLLFGLFQGLRHAFEPDHVVAVSTMLSEQRAASARIRYAVSWGMGHATMLVLVGATLMILRAELPPRLDAIFEVTVAIMLLTLGLRAVLMAARQARPSTATASTARRYGAIGPLAMGMVHGLAGSGALTALVMARLPSPLLGVIFMTFFGLGATIGMSLLAGAAGVPLTRLLRTRWGMPALLAATGCLSLALGAAWIGPALARVVAS